MNQLAQPQQWWRPVAISAALAMLFATVLSKLGHDWWDDPNYSHGLLVPFIIGYILWSERDLYRRTEKWPATMLGGTTVVLGLLGLWAGTVGAELYVQRMSLVLMLAGITLYFFGPQILKRTAVPLLLLVLAIPIPTIIFNKIAFPLQIFASRCAVWSMRLFDIPVLREGNIIELMPLGSTQTKKLEVVEACSGIRSLMTLVTLAVVFSYFTYPKGNGSDGQGLSWRLLRSYGFWRSVIIVLAAIPIAILTNALRVSGTGVLARYYGTEIADGFFHSFSGWVVYVVSLVLLFTVGWLVDRVAKLMSKNRGAAPVPAPPAQTPPAWPVKSLNEN